MTRNPSDSFTMHKSSCFPTCKAKAREQVFSAGGAKIGEKY